MTPRSEQALRPFSLVAIGALIALAAAPFSGHALAPGQSPAPAAPHVEVDPEVSTFIQSGGVAPDMAEAG